MSIGLWLKNFLFSDASNAHPLSSPQPNTKIITTIAESQNNKIDTWKNNQDIIDGMKFCATMQLRTPLRVLSRHGETHTDINSEPPKIANELWEGIWVLEVKPYPGQPLAQFGQMASSIGQISQDGGDYLPFLIAVREIVESDDSIESRIKRLSEMPMVGNWQMIVNRHGPSHISKSRGIDWIIEYFFPRFTYAIPKINSTTAEELSTLGLDTPNSIASAPDETLLGIKGIGQSKLKAIRDYCASNTKNRDAKRLDSVTR